MHKPKWRIRLELPILTIEFGTLPFAVSFRELVKGIKVLQLASDFPESLTSQLSFAEGPTESSIAYTLTLIVGPAYRLLTAMSMQKVYNCAGIQDFDSNYIIGLTLLHIFKHTSKSFGFGSKHYEP